MARDNLLTYPDFNETFKINIDASALQLGAIISQKGKHIAFYSRKLTDDQQQYTVTERELLIIVETPKQFRTILLGQKLQIYTDHRNLMCKTFNTDILLLWRLKLEEYGPDIEYIKVENNIVADGLSRIPLNGNQETTQKSTYQQEIVSEINDIKEILEGTFSIYLKLIQKYQGLEPSIRAKYKYGTYHQGSLRRSGNIDLILITCKDNICIP